jgi:hypothetical protein
MARKLVALCGMVSSVLLLASAMMAVPRISLVGLIAITGATGIVAFLNSIGGLLFEFVLGFIIAGGLTPFGLVFAF